MPQFHHPLFLTQIFWLFVFFALLYFFLSVYICPEIESVIHDRDHMLHQELKKIDEYDAEYNNINDKITKMNQVLSINRAEIIAKADVESQKILKSKNDEMNKRIAEALSHSTHEILRFKSEILLHVESEIADLSKNVKEIIVKTYKS